MKRQGPDNSGLLMLYIFPVLLYGQFVLVNNMNQYYFLDCVGHEEPGLQCTPALACCQILQQDKENIKVQGRTQDFIWRVGGYWIFPGTCRSLRARARSTPIS